jgi:hypothetical protein
MKQLSLVTTAILIVLTASIYTVKTQPISSANLRADGEISGKNYWQKILLRPCVRSHFSCQSGD